MFTFNTVTMNALIPAQKNLEYKKIDIKLYNALKQVLKSPANVFVNALFTLLCSLRSASNLLPEKGIGDELFYYISIDFYQSSQSQ